MLFEFNGNLVQVFSAQFKHLIYAPFSYAYTLLVTLNMKTFITKNVFQHQELFLPDAECDTVLYVCMSLSTLKDLIICWVLRNTSLPAVKCVNYFKQDGLDVKMLPLCLIIIGMPLRMAQGFVMKKKLSILFKFFICLDHQHFLFHFSGLIQTLFSRLM